MEVRPDRFKVVAAKTLGKIYGYVKKKKISGEKNCNELMLKFLKQIMLSSKRRGGSSACGIQNDGQIVRVRRCLKVGWLHDRTSKVTQDPRFQDQDACRPWIRGVG